MTELKAVHQFTVFCSATPLEHAALAGLSMPQSYYEKLRADYRERREHLARLLDAAGFRYQMPQGTYFVMADYSSLSRMNDFDFSLWMTEKIGVAVLPTSVFYTDPAAVAERQKYVRFAFCKDLGMMREAAKRLEKSERSLWKSLKD